MGENALDDARRTFVDSLSKNQAYRVLMDMKRQLVVESAPLTVRTVTDHIFKRMGDTDPHEAVRQFITLISDDEVAQLIARHRRGEYPD